VPPLRLLVVCGSLRAASHHASLLRAAAALVPDGTTLELYAEAGSLPLFNPDLEPAPPAVVLRLWAAVTAADAVVIASPEYAHGVSAVIKNVLDWLVGLPAFYGKPVAVFNASPRARHADAALRETLCTMSAGIVEDASVTLPILGSGLDTAGILARRDLAEPLRAALATLCRVAGPRSSDASPAFDAPRD
jgi:NAD(P)H-dependent FMN reductase